MSSRNRRREKLLEYYDLLHLDAVGGSDDPPVGDERGAALVLELAALVLPQTHLIIIIINNY